MRTNRANSTMPVTMCFQKYHQCGRRSSATSSPGFSSFLGYGTPKFYDAGRTANRMPSGPHVSGKERRHVVAAVRVDVDRDQEPAGAFRVREAVDEGVVRGPV